MIAEMNRILGGRKILILGYGREGRSTHAFLRSYISDIEIGIADRNEQLITEYPGMVEDTDVKLFLGKDYINACSGYDVVIKSPGISYGQLTAACDPAKITSQTDLFLRAFSQRVIGVTGTKGKSTTTTLIYHIMKQAGRNVILSGNIGIPPLSLAGEMSPDTVAVFEMSSHQLERITIAPGTAVLLNIFPEHLDHYRDFTAYKMAKFNISLMQARGGRLIYHADDPVIAELMQDFPAIKQSMAFSIGPGRAVAASFDGQHININGSGQGLSIPVNVATDLPGSHNILNMMAALLVCSDHGLNREEMISGLSTYKRPEHRLEHAGTFHGITFYNDSIATVPQASIEALKTIGFVDLLILGGFDRGIDYDILYQRLREHPVPHLVFMGDAGRRMYDAMQKDPPGGSSLYFVNGLDGAFDIIRGKLVEGSVCLLSPAAASYDAFKDFADRGRTFKKMAAEL